MCQQQTTTEEFFIMKIKLLRFHPALLVRFLRLLCLGEG